MEFDLSPEQEQFRNVVREFAAAEIAPHAADWDRDHTFPVDTVLAMGRLGLFGLPFPQEYGGGGADYLTYCLAIEELARVDASMAITLEAGVSLGAAPFHYSGTEAQKQEYLVPMIAGEVLGAFGLTEAEAGSDAGATRTRAVLDDPTGEWVIDGQKTFITNSGTPITKCVTITARTADNEISNIVVDAGTPGFTVMAPYRKMGWHASDTHELVFDGCRVPEDKLLGTRGEGFKTFLRILDEGRIAIAALAVGLAAGMPRRVRRVRPRAVCVRRPHRPLSVDRIQVCRHGGRGRERPEPHVQGGLHARPRPPVPEGVGDGQAVLE